MPVPESLGLAYSTDIAKGSLTKFALLIDVLREFFGELEGTPESSDSLIGFSVSCQHDIFGIRFSIAQISGG
ncbi:MAG: hypothetical protein V3R86_00120 [Candidatus Hydrothermarchaeaceae archaeon]